ncbi:MAG: D-tyrosyl-tRNA(Tyr) deacylase [Gammaproteobacteria bacterium]|nr:D-tyrosyl-tRNA(Tyr) deacylase [Gammaproteobacteria bacterium]|tara:strand:+ start:264 stop:707 length:444 start_codon:yes stop_codon:yes gene_type:complete
MKFVIQRVSSASVIIDNTIYSKIESGLLLFIGIEKGDNNSKLDYYVRKIINMRIFNDQNLKMNNSLLDINGSILVVSQFTLLANTKKGNRPSYINAEDPELAYKLYNEFIQNLKNYDINVKKGRFGAHMQLSFINDGPVTIILSDEE